MGAGIGTEGGVGQVVLQQCCFPFTQLAYEMVTPTFRAAKKAPAKVRAEPRQKNHQPLHQRVQHLEPAETSSAALPLQLCGLQHDSLSL